MLCISEMVQVVGALDDRSHSPQGDSAARLWGFESATYLRSSASHVFVTDATPAKPERLVLRMRQRGSAGDRAIERSARAAAALMAAGAPVAAPVLSARGDLVEGTSRYVVTALEALQGQ